MIVNEASSEDSAFLSREELLGGLHAKRASTLLFAIESKTAQMVLQSRQAASRVVSMKAVEAKERAFLDALSQGRDLPEQPTIQELERYAKEWAPLVSTEPGLRATAAYLISQKYIFTYKSIPSIRRALGLDHDDVKATFESRYGFPLADIYAPAVSRFERVRWVWSGIAYRLDNLPPFWIVFALTLTEAVGACILALPIALGGMGVIAGIVQVVVLGLVNILTIAALSESVVRNGNLRYGSSYFGRLITDFLGSPGYYVLIITFLILNITIFIAYGIGVAQTLANATGIPAFVWPLPLFLIDLYVLLRQSYSATIASNLVIGAINLALILLMALLSFPHVRLENLSYLHVPFLDGRPFDPTSLSLVFGVILWTYFGYTSPVSSARLALHRDPSGRSLISGAIAAMVVAIAFNCIWLIAVGGTVAPSALAADTGTGLGLLASQVGPAINLLGLIFVVLAMGMSMISYSLAVFSQVDEWLSEWRERELPKQNRAFLASWLHELTANPAGHFMVGAIPVVLMFLATGLLLMTREDSFAAPLSFLGTLAVPLLVGIFPVLMLAASRRKGDYVPAAVFRWLGHPILLLSIYIMFLGTIFIYGLVIWQDPFQRLSALIASVVMLGMTFAVIRRGALTPRAIVEVRVERNPEEVATLSITSDGAPIPVDVQLSYPDGEKSLSGATAVLEDFPRLRSATFLLRLKRAHELKVWLHQVTPQGNSQGLPARIQVHSDSQTLSFELDQSDAQVLMPLAASNGSPVQLQVEFS